MHNNRIKGKWLAVLAVLLPWVSWAQVPPPVVRNVLDTNLVSFGTTGQALFRTTALPFINWSNVLASIGITNAVSGMILTSNTIVLTAVTNATNTLWGWVPVLIGASNNMYILKLDGFGTNTTIYGSPAGTNWTVTGPGGFLNTNVAGGMILGANGKLSVKLPIETETNVFEAIGTNGIAGGKSVVIDQLGQVSIGSNAAVANFSVFGTNASGILFQVGSRNIATASAGGTNAIIVETNGNVGLGIKPTVNLTVASEARIAGRLAVADVVYLSGPISGTLSLRGYNDLLNFNSIIFGTNSTSGTNCAGIFISNTVATVSSPRISILAHNGSSPANLYVPNGVLYGSNTTATTVHSTNGVWSGTAVGTTVQPIHAWGQLCTSGTNAVWLPAAATYTNVFSSATNNVVAISTNEFYGAPTVAGTQPADTPALTNVVAGWYMIRIHASFLGQSSGAYEFEAFTNSVACESCAVPHNCDNPARTTSCSASHICYLPAGCRVTMRVKGGATETIGLNRASLIITSP